MDGQPSPIPVYTRDDSSGRVHRRYRTPSGHLVSIEADNLDDAGAWTEISEADAEAAPRTAKCSNCFPEPVAAGAEPGPADTPI